MKKWFVFVLLLTSCGDFLNTKPTVITAPATSNPNLQKNPFPPGYENPNEGSFSEEKMLVNIGVNVISKRVKKFSLQAELLADTLSSCRDLGEAREQWKRTALAFHTVDAFPVGPMTDNGRFLLDNLYAWPYLDTCGIDNEVAKGAVSGKYSDQLLYTLKGLGAMEYLLFESSLGSSCNLNRYPEVRAWLEKSPVQKEKDRCRFAGFLAKDFSAKSKILDQSWDPNEANFTKTLIDGSRYESVKSATNALTDSLFSIEKMKDLRMGKPLGLHKDCTNESKKCVESLEHPYAKISKEALEARLTGFRDVFFGSASSEEKAFGLDDFLVSRGTGATKDAMQGYLTDASRSIRDLGELRSEISSMNAADCAATTRENRLVPVCAAFQDLRAITSLWKIEVMTALALRAPADHAGDND